MESMYDIKQRMDRVGTTQVIFAQAAGMSQPQLSLLINGYKTPREDTLKRLSKALDTIEHNRNAIANGIFIIDELVLRTEIFRAIRPLIEEPFNDPHKQAQRLVTAIYEGITKAEE